LFHFFHKSFISGETVDSDTNGEPVDIAVTSTFSGDIHPVDLLRSSFQIFTRTKESAQYSRSLDTNNKILASSPEYVPLTDGLYSQDQEISLVYILNIVFYLVSKIRANRKSAETLQGARQNHANLSSLEKPNRFLAWYLPDHVPKCT